VPNVKKIWGLNLPGTLWATLACCGRPLPFTYKQKYQYNSRYSERPHKRPKSLPENSEYGDYRATRKPFVSPALLAAKHISALCADISCINDMQSVCTDIPSFHVSVGNICKPTGYTIDHWDWDMHSKLHISIAPITCDFRIRHGQQPTSHISFSFRAATKLKFILGNVKPVATTSWHAIPKSKLIAFPPFEYIRTMMT
jgi:hypothetical protein